MAQEKYGKLCKDALVNDLLSRFKESPNFVITSYMGTSVSDLEKLRKSLKKSKAEYLVVKNSILKVAFEKGQLKNEVDKIDGGMGISFSGADIISTCKALVTFSKEHGAFKIKGAIVDGKSLPPDRVKVLASLPSKEVLLAQVVGGIKAPITGFVTTLGAVLRKFVCVVDAIKVSKGKMI